MIGLIIGDGHISSQHNIIISHCIKQKEYLVYKTKLLHSVVGGKDINIHEKLQKYSYWVDNEKIIKTAEICRIKKGSTNFKWLRELMYPENKKIITQKTLDMIDETSIMLWWLDDGNLDKHKSGSGSICWQLRWNTFVSETEVKLIQKYFKEKWDINWNIGIYDKRTPKWCLKCGKKEGEKFFTIFRNKVLEKIPSMAYKVLFNDTSAEQLIKADDIV